MTETELHLWLDSYANKDAWKADVSGISVDSIISGFLETDSHLYNTIGTLGHTIHRLEYINSMIYINTNLLVNGDGSQRNPYNNVNDAKDTAELLGIRTVSLTGSVIVPGNLKNMTIYGTGVPEVETNGQDLLNTKFINCRLNGNYTNSIIAQECVLTDGFILNGFFDRCAIEGTLYCATSAAILLSHCFSNMPGTDRPFISMNSGAATKLGIRGYSGGLTLLNADHIDDTCTIEVAQGALTIDSSCTAGVIVTRGNCKFIDESIGATVIDETFYKDIIPTAEENASTLLGRVI